MELLLWRWSTLVQVSSALLIAVFFVVLARSVGRAELRPWVHAWVANLAALAVTIVFWRLQPATLPMLIGASALYIFAKTLFVVLLVAGAVRFGAGPSDRWTTAKLAIGAVVFASFGALVVRSVPVLGIWQATTLAVVLIGGAASLRARKTPGFEWLAIGFLVRGTLAALEALAYVAQWWSAGAPAQGSVAIYIASHSSFDTGAEWMIALGCVLMLYRTIQQELTAANGELGTARDALQALLDRDQLTGVYNRRALPAILRDVQASGAAVLFFDLDGFKQINDAHGHHAGDECLKRFARALQESFRSGDHVVRYAGDEFIVVAPGIDAAGVEACLAVVRGHLRFMPADGPQVGFSVGLAQLAPGGDPDAALRAADQAMYRDKAA